MPTSPRCNRLTLARAAGSGIIRRMEVRAATVDDVDAVLPLVANTCAFHQAMDGQKYPFLRDPARRYCNWLRGCATDGQTVFLVATDADAIVGFLVATVDDEIPIYRVKRYGFIHDLWVEPDHRRHGLGRRLLQEAVARFGKLNVQQVRLDVLVGNAPAQKLFASCGFRQSVVEMILPLAEA